MEKMFSQQHMKNAKDKEILKFYRNKRVQEFSEVLCKDTTTGPCSCGYYQVGDTFSLAHALKRRQVMAGRKDWGRFVYSEQVVMVSPYGGGEGKMWNNAK